MLTAAFVAGLLVCLVACSAPKSLEYRDFRNFRVESVGFNQSAVAVDLIYFNPNNFGINLKHIDCDIYIDKNYLGKFVLDTMLHIPNKAEFILPAHMRVDMKNMYRNALNTLMSSEVLVEVKGNIKAGKAGVFLNFPFSYSQRQKLSFY